MTGSGLSLSEDLGPVVTSGVVALVAVAALLLLLELRAREKRGALIFLTGLIAAALFAAAVLRPVRVSTKGNVVGPRIVVLVDQSRRLLLPESEGTRRDRAERVVAALSQHFSTARLSVFGFGEGAPAPTGPSGFDPEKRPTTESDLTAALEAVASAPSERPRALVVVSDGRLTRPGLADDTKAADGTLGSLGIPIHTVRLSERAPPDAAIRSVRAAGAAVAHQPLAITVEVACSGGIKCGDVPVRIQELRSGVEPAELASGTAKVEEGSGTIELDVTLDRAGPRVVEVSLDAPEGDQIRENDARILTFSVARERVRLLHLAGRPTYDVRALRTWLKSDESVDVVAFFILRGDTDDPEADDQDLALIEFPVTELFTTHLSSFDAVILQDIDAIKYKLAQYLPRLTRYVENGGGLIMVGGPSSFAGGSYAGTPLDSVLPVSPTQGAETSDTTGIVPRYTESGRAALVTRKVIELLGDSLPEMAGSNLVGPARPGSIVLWEHPKLEAGGAPMPLLALGEQGDGRAIALALDATHRLLFSTFAANVAGRGYGALWDGLLGWLMRDPRYEAARVELVGECIAGEPATLRVTKLPGTEGEVELWLEKLGATKKEPLRVASKDATGSTVDLKVESVEPGGYTARVKIGASPPARHDFACERAGSSFRDSRPDPERLRQISKATEGRSVAFDSVDDLPLPEATRVDAERRVSPVLPPWAWTLSASVFLGAHWLLRRKGGMV